MTMCKLSKYLQITILLFLEAQIKQLEFGIEKVKTIFKNSKVKITMHGVYQILQITNQFYLKAHLNQLEFLIDKLILNF